MSLKGGIIMANTISLTVRLPKELSQKLKTISKEIGITRSNLIRLAIHDFLLKDAPKLDFNTTYTKETDRFVLNINTITQNILEDACKKYNQSMNAIITAVSILALERSTKWIQSLKN